MIEEIFSKYNGFPDGLIVEVNYKRYLLPSGRDESMIEVCLRTYNELTEEYEIVMLIFTGIIAYRFVEEQYTSNLILYDVFFKQENEVFTIDFDPIIYKAHSDENPDSMFKIKCKDISYRVLPLYPNGSKMLPFD